MKFHAYLRWERWRWLASLRSRNISRCGSKTRFCSGNCRPFTDYRTRSWLPSGRYSQSRVIMGQGNPGISKHPVTPEDCEAKLRRLAVNYDNPRFEKICGAKYMAPLYDPATQKPEDAQACIDQFEFPDIPCALSGGLGESPRSG